MKLSIITPYFDALDYTTELANKLIPQLNKDVEWIIIDDGCHEKELNKFSKKVLHLAQNRGCAGLPRNIGLDAAQGEYITFVDADDLVADNFIEAILNKINTSTFDYCYMNWERLDKLFHTNVKKGRPEWNCSVWGIVYKKTLINSHRFNDKKIAEDYDFNKEVLNGTQEIITDFLYFYRLNKKGISRNY